MSSVRGVVAALSLGGLVAGASVSPVFAQALSAEPRILTKLSNGEALAPPERRQLARIWRDEILHIQENLPALSEAEAAYLQTDLDDELRKNADTPTKRSRAARSSTAFKKRFVAETVDENGKLLTILRSSTLTAEREALVWARLSANWLDRSFNASLVDLTRDDPSLRAVVFSRPDQSAEGFIQARQRRGRSILLSMVIPHLTGP